MDLIDREFTTNSLNKAYEPAIRVALNVAKKTLNRYYTKTDQSEVYRIAMSESYFPFYKIQLSNHVAKFCTPVINSPTSGTTDGQMRGSTLRRTLYAPSSTGNTVVLTLR